MNPTIQLKLESIMHIPMDKYDQDFTFIVNGEEYRTSRIFADLLSRKISKLHFTDPTNDKIYINTGTKGDFKRFLSILNFQINDLRNEDIKFIREISEQLETTDIEIKVNRPEITIENALDRLFEDERFSNFYSSEIEKDIEFVSANFSEIKTVQKDNFKKLEIFTLERIFCNDNFKIDSEDDLLEFVNELFKDDDKYSKLYSHVYFENVGVDKMNEFIDIFSIEYLTPGTWESLSNRLKQKVCMSTEKFSERYKGGTSVKRDDSCKRSVEYNNDHYSGIIDYFRKESNINEEVKITASSIVQCDLQKVLQKDFPTNNFATNNISGSWICVEFKNHQVIPTHYTIRSNNCDSNGPHPRNWVIEGSSDSSNWEQIDEQKENSFLNGKSQVFTFPIRPSNQHKFKFIRIRQTGVNWQNGNHLYMNYIEFFGKIY